MNTDRLLCLRSLLCGSATWIPWMHRTDEKKNTEGESGLWHDKMLLSLSKYLHAAAEVTPGYSTHSTLTWINLPIKSKFSCYSGSSRLALNRDEQSCSFNSLTETRSVIVLRYFITETVTVHVFTSYSTVGVISIVCSRSGLLCVGCCSHDPAPDKRRKMDGPFQWPFVKSINHIQVYCCPRLL